MGGHGFTGDRRIAGERYRDVGVPADQLAHHG
jgi:hypothetical protein